MDLRPTPSTVNLMRRFNVVIGHCPTASTIMRMRESNIPQLESPQAPFPLLKLAPELHLLLSESLEPIDRISLKLTNRYFYLTIPSFQPDELSNAQQQLYKRRGPAKQAIPGTNLKQEIDPYLACMCCFRLRPMLKFADEQQRWSPVLKVGWHRTKDLKVPSHVRLPRLCITCGIYNGRVGHLPGNIIPLDGKEVVVCNFCIQYGWIGAREVRRRAAGLCDKCWKVLEVNRGSEANKGPHQDELQVGHE